MAGNTPAGSDNRRHAPTTEQRQHQPLQKVLLVLTVARRDRFYLTRRYERFFGGVADSAEVS